MKKFIFRSVVVLVATVTASCFSFTGMAAASATINNTGPGSYNSISSKNENKCVVTNNNNLSAKNNVSQVAKSGDATVSHNTNAGSGWGEWDPAHWAAQGYTYEQWHSAFTAHMQSNAASWKANWGSMAASGGGATTGNASNVSNNNVTMNVENDSDACAANPGRGGDNEIDTTGPGSKNVIKNVDKDKTNISNNNKLTSGNNVGQHAKSGDAASRFNTSAGGAGTGGAGNQAGHGVGMGVSSSGSKGGSGGAGGGTTPGRQGGGDNTISNTGPDSYNSISNKTVNSTKVTNNNNVYTSNNNDQYSSSGNANVSYNTNAGGASTGDGANTSNNNTVVGIKQ